MSNNVFRQKIHIEEGFLDSFHQSLNQSLNISHFDNKDYETLNNKLKLLLNLFNANTQISVDLKEEKIKSILKMNDSSEIKSYEEFLIKKLLKKFNNLSLNNTEFNFNESILYLSSKDKNELVDGLNIYNCYAKSKYDSFESYPLPNSIVGLYVDDEMNGIEKIAHRCRNVLIVDPYLFRDSSNKALKVPNIVKFLKLLGLDNESVQCHFSAIVMYEDETISIKKKIEEIEGFIGNPNLKVSVYAIQDSKGRKPKFMGANRYFMTDYCFGEYQHIFDRVGSLSANFFHENSTFDYTTMDYCINEIRKKYIVDAKKIGLIQQKFGDILENPLLK